MEPRNLNVVDERPQLRRPRYRRLVGAVGRPYVLL